MFEPNSVIHRSEILASGASGHDITEYVAMGMLTRLWRGFYTTGEAVGLPDPRGATRSMRVVLSHQSAAAWCGVDLPAAVDRLHVTAPRNRGRRADIAQLVRLHRRDLDPGDVMKRRGLRITSPMRTVTDVARTCSLDHAVAIADGYLRLGMTTPAELVSYVAGLPQAFGRPQARRVVELVDPASGSVFESITRVLLAEAGLPPPVTQYNVHDSAGTWIGRVDFCWPAARLVLECDGFEYHSSREAFNRDRRRWSALGRAGWQVAVVTWHDVVSDPSYVVGLVAHHLAAG